MRHTTWRCESVACNRAACKRCPHGPYWYGYFREGGRLIRKYHGKTDPRTKSTKTRTFETIPSDQRRKILNPDTANADLAHSILSTHDGLPWDKITSAYKMLMEKNPPDRGGDVLECQYITAAFVFLKAYYRK